MNLHEVIGEQQVQLRGVQQSLQIALDIIRTLKSGELALDRITVSDNGDVSVSGLDAPAVNAPVQLNRHGRRALAKGNGRAPPG